MMTANRGHRHDAVCYDSDEHLLAVVVPFLLGGIAAGEPTVVSLGERAEGLVRAILPPGDGVTFLAGGAVYARPASVIRQYRNLFADHVAAGAGRIRIIGELPSTAHGITWDWWARYEAAVNELYDDFPVWSMCAYDTRITPEVVLADVRRTHRRTVLPGGRHLPHPEYTEPAAFLGEPRRPLPDPLQQAPPRADLTDPSPGRAREAIREVHDDLLGREALDGMLLAVSEAVSNAHRHGRGPVRMRAWTGADRVVVSVSDTGAGPADPFAGLLPAGDGTAGGFGLWLTHLFCDHVALDRGRPEGYTIRLTAVTGNRTTASNR
ncbi:anti-sigma factor RsbA family regulatory protein [Actinoplanes sp. NPDC024001]|uniref:anti-sigma factor RsbA family regulatory protein n=1 Tax=Actinoplanes sp. NPDC024001 TaxID=3154598 RepID=UPI0033F772C2